MPAASTAHVASGVFAASFMSGTADVTLEVTRLIGMEVVEWLFAALWERACVAVVRVVAVIDVAVETGASVIPVTRSNEGTSDEPVRPIEAVGRAVVGGIIEVSVGTDRFRAELDGDLGWSGGVSGEQANASGKAKE